MAAKKTVKATKLIIGLPFNLGSREFKNNEAQQNAAWSLYVELSTRIAVRSLEGDEGILREALTSLYNMFNITRQILRDAGPDIARGPQSLGAIAIDVLNKGLRPFIAKWHPLLMAWEEQKPSDRTTINHEHLWDRQKEFRQELNQVREQLVIYVDALAKISGIE